MIFISRNNICILSIQSSKSLISSLPVLELLLLLPHSLYSLSDLSPSEGPDISLYKILMGVIKPCGKATSALCNHSWCYSREGSGGGGGVLLLMLLRYLERVRRILGSDRREIEEIRGHMAGVTVSLSAMISIVNSHGSQMFTLSLNPL